MGAEYKALDLADTVLFQLDHVQWFHQAWRFDRRSRRRSVVVLLNELGDAIMTRGSKKPVPTAGVAKASWTTFVDIPVAPEAWRDVSDAFGDWEAVLQGVAEVVSTGHRVSVSYNGQNDSFTVSLTGKGDNCVNDGCTLVSFASTWDVALRVALYKHLIIADGDWAGNAVVAARSSFG